MKKYYIKPDCFSFVAESIVMMDNSEPEITENIGAKENYGFDFSDDDPFGDLWDDDEPGDDPFSTGN